MLSTNLMIFITLVMKFGHTIADNVQNNMLSSNAIPAVDSLLEKIGKDDWQDQVCRVAMKKLLLGVKANQLWSIWIWDSMQSPVGTAYGSKYQLGNYDQCVKAPWLSNHPERRTQYCLVEIKFSDSINKFQNLDAFDSAQEYYNTTSIFGRHLGLLVWGLCLPSKCKRESVAKISKLMYEDTHLPKGQLDIKVLSCEKSGEIKELSYGLYLLLGIIAVSFTIAMLSTIYHVDKNDVDASAVSKIAASFDMKNNFESLFASYKDEIKVINSIRSITTFFIIVFHIYIFVLPGGIMNSLVFDELLQSSLGYIFLHMDLCVDTFFVLSALLFTRNLMSTRKKNIVIMPIKRYIRFIGSLAFGILCISELLPYIISGPYSTFIQREQSICHRTWWKHLLMIDNEVTEMCGLYTWYILCDFQLGLLGTILVYIYSKNKKYGYIAYGVTFLAALFIPAYITYWYKLPVLPLAVVEDIIHFRENKVFNYKYIRSYARAGAYLIGMAMGYIVFKYNPAKYRNTISKRLSVIGFIMFMALFVLCFASGKIINDRVYDPIEAGIVSALDRPLWAVVICILIGICEYGNLSYVTDILSWNAFVPLSHLAYGIYLSHPIILLRNVAVARSPITYDALIYIVNILGIFLASVAASIALWFLVEAPFSNITGYFLFPKIKRDKKKDN